ncbi:MAG: hypothetical protein CM1200mP30_18520 [Pseudomonadota bacterium]|nr:MAG: hypothetical protein CM1200mP30_18520 [Pseudomonadota bacterium]
MPVFPIVIVRKQDCRQGISWIIQGHQFSKIEMFAFTHPDQSEEMHQKMLEIEEHIYQDLGFHIRWLILQW